MQNKTENNSDIFLNLNQNLAKIHRKQDGIMKRQKKELLKITKKAKNEIQATLKSKLGIKDN